MAETRTINLEIKDNVKSLKTQYREAIQEVQTLADTYGNTSKEAAEAAKRAAELKDRIEESKSLTDAFNPDAKFNALSGSIGGVLNGFQAYEGALGLIGSESEALQETLLKVQSAMALSQGIQGALEAKDAFVNLGSVVKNSLSGMTKASKLFAVTGIGLLITGITLLITNFDKVVAFIKPVIDAVKAIGDAIGLTDFAGEEAAAKEKKRKEREAADIKRQIELKQRAFEEEQKAIQRTINLYNAQGKDVEKLTRLKLENAAKVKKALLEEQKQLVSNTEYYAKNGSDLQRTIAQTSQDILAQSIQEAKDAQNELDVFNAEQEKKRKDKAKENAKERADNNKNLLKQIEDAQIEAIQNEDIRARAKLLKDAERSTQEINKLKANEEKKATLTKLIDEKLQRDLQALDDKRLREEQEAIKAANSFRIQQERELAKTIEDIAEQNYQRTLTEQEKEILAVNDKYFELQTLAQGNADALNEIELAKLNELNDINLKYDAEEKARKDAADAAEKQRIKQLNEYRVQAVQDGLQTISNLAELFAGKSEKQQKRAFQVQKAVNIANAVIDTYKAANTALASSPPPFNYIAMAAAITAGLVNVKKIASQQFQSSSSSSGGGGTPSAPEVTSAAPQFNTIGSSGINQLAQLQQQPVQAYVVSGEVTSAQALDRNRIQNATL